MERIQAEEMPEPKKVSLEAPEDDSRVAELERKLQLVINENLNVKDALEIAKEKAHRMLEQKDEEIDELKSQLLRGGDSTSSVMEASNMTAGEMVNNQQVMDGGVDKQYIRVSLIKYLTFLAKGKDKEAMKLETVLWTVL